jgi:hypothetical protein
MSEMKPIRQKPRIAAADSATPKWNGAGSITQPALATGASDTLPITAPAA